MDRENNVSSRGSHRAILSVSSEPPALSPRAHSAWHAPAQRRRHRGVGNDAGPSAVLPRFPPPATLAQGFAGERIASCQSSPIRLGADDTASSSFVPLTVKWSSGPALEGVPRATTVPSFDTKPLFLMTRRIFASVMVLPGFRSRIVSPSFKLTFTASTPATFSIATRTAWAQISQSMPSVLISTCRNSARADAGSTTAMTNVKRAMVLSFMAISYFNQKKYATLTAIRTRSLTEPSDTL